jgi:hypothetical protein
VICSLCALHLPLRPESYPFSRTICCARWRLRLVVTQTKLSSRGQHGNDRHCWPPTQSGAASSGGRSRSAPQPRCQRKVDPGPSGGSGIEGWDSDYRGTRSHMLGRTYHWYSLATERWYVVRPGEKPLVVASPGHDPEDRLSTTTEPAGPSRSVPAGANPWSPAKRPPHRASRRHVPRRTRHRSRTTA